MQNDALLSEQKPRHVLLITMTEILYFADAGATIIEDTDEDGGLLSHRTATYTIDETYYIYAGVHIVILKTITPNTSKWRGAKCMSLH